MGLPEIFIAFQTAAVSAITRSARGRVALVVKDDTAEGAAQESFTALSDVPKSHYTAGTYRLLSLTFAAAPSRVVVLRAGEDSTEVFARLKQLDFDWLAAPALENAEVVSFIQSQRGAGRSVKAVVANAASPDCEGIVNLCVKDLILSDGAVEPAVYTGRIAGLLAALPLTRSATYAELPEVVGCAAVEDPDEDIDAGRLIVVPGGSGYRLGRAVTSLVTLTTDRGAPFQKIKIVEGTDLIRRDIAAAFESGYIGKVLNDYDSKLLLVTAVNSYLSSLEGDVLDPTADNACAISLSGQRRWLQSRGVDVSAMKDAAVLRANTGSEVFLQAELTFCDAMEDLTLTISM